MIDIIIPCYNAHDTLAITLNSIIIQSIKDKIKVLLVDDCSNKDYNDYINKYKNYIDISVIRLENNSGPGVAREVGIKNTTSKYIIFIDSDDIFFSSNSVELLYNKIEESYDLVNSLEFDQKLNSYLLLNGNVHAKIYRREYIENNNIHFINTRYHEDNYFNNLVILSGARIATLYEFTYYYTYNENSITNKDSKEFDRLELYLKNMNILINTVKDKCSKVRLARYKREKYRYLYRIYNSFSKQEKEKFKEWINKYDTDYLPFIDTSRKVFISILIDYLYRIIHS